MENRDKNMNPKIYFSDRIFVAYLKLRNRKWGAVGKSFAARSSQCGNLKCARNGENGRLMERYRGLDHGDETQKCRANREQVVTIFFLPSGTTKTYVDDTF
jgi:hypothetical protein